MAWSSGSGLAAVHALQHHRAHRRAEVPALHGRVGRAVAAGAADVERMAPIDVDEEGLDRLPELTSADEAFLRGHAQREQSERG